MLFLHFYSYFRGDISAMSKIKILPYEEKSTDILKAKAIMYFALSLILKGGKKMYLEFHLLSL